MTDILTGAFPGPPATGQFPGVTVGTVSNVDDPAKRGRVKVKLILIAGQEDSAWAQVATPMAGAGRGMYFIPEVGDLVLVAFAHGAPECPYVIGSLWNGRDEPPVPADGGKNDVREIRSRSGHTIRLTDTADAETIEIVDAGGRNRVVLSTKDKRITVTADAEVVVETGGGRLRIDRQGVAITSEAGLSVKAKTALTLESEGQVTIKGKLVDIN